MDISFFIIALAWAGFLLFWVISVAGKNGTDRVPNLVRTVILLAAVGALFGFIGAGGIPGDINPMLWPRSLGVELGADVIVILSLIVLIRSRRVLGANWSSNVSVDKATTLVRSGPYAYVRHPIYSGFIGLILGTLIAYGRLVGILIWAIAVVALYLKARKEDGLMAEKFIDEYADYKSKTKALFPFLL